MRPGTAMSPVGRLLLLPLLWVAPAFAEAPRLSWSPDDGLVLADLPPVLDQAVVDRQLKKGLTTAFVFRVESPETAEPWVATIEIRYELWDEQYLVTIRGGDREAESMTLPSRQELGSWWTATTIPMCEATRLPQPPRRAKVSLHLIPFSRSEQIETQRWFAESVRRAGQGEGSTSSPDESGTSLDRVFDSLIATSIRRRSVIQWDWTLEVEAEEEP